MRHKDTSPVLRDFAALFTRCWCCGTMAIHTYPPELQIHHIVRGNNREKAREERCVMIRTCGPCHSKHLDGMPIARQLALKKIYDHDGYDRVLVNQLRHRADDAVSEGEVTMEVHELQAQIEQSGWVFPQHVHGR